MTDREGLKPGHVRSLNLRERRKAPKSGGIPQNSTPRGLPLHGHGRALVLAPFCGRGKFFVEVLAAGMFSPSG